MNEELWKPGTVVELINNVGMSAPLGSCARVLQSSKDYVTVEWLDKIKQQNGNYNATRFIVTNMEDTREYLRAVSGE